MNEPGADVAVAADDAAKAPARFIVAGDNVASMQEAVNKAVADGKIAADVIQVVDRNNLTAEMVLAGVKDPVPLTVSIFKKFAQTFQERRVRAAIKAMNNPVSVVRCEACQQGTGTLHNLVVYDTDDRGKLKKVKKKVHKECRGKIAAGVLG